MKQEHENSENKIRIDKDSLNSIFEYTDNALFLIENQYKKPWKNLSLRLSNRILMFLSSLRYCFSEKQRKKFRDSANKRNNSKFIKQWPVKKAIFWRQNVSNQIPFNVESPVLEDIDYTLNENNILVMDYRLPRSDTSAGEKATFGLLRDLCRLGFNVTFAPEDMRKVEPYWQQLSDIGVNVITKENGYLSLDDYIKKEGEVFGAYYFIRVDVAERALPEAEKIAPFARKIFHAPDLYFLRETRAAELSGNEEDLIKANETKERELAMMGRCDHIVVVSPAEVPILQKFLPNQSISVFPALYVDVESTIIPYKQRNDVFFLGGFAHTPNVDSVIWFCKEVWPLIHKELPNVTFYIIGAEAPAKVRALGNIEGVSFIGYVEDLKPSFERYRVGVAPLLYGAGIKGKVAATMGAGIPCVCTHIASEGMGIENGYNGLVADDPQEFANLVIRAYNDETLWNILSKHGLDLVGEKFGEAANRADFFRLLQAAQALPLSLYENYISVSTVTSFPVYNEDTPINVSIIVPVYNKWSLTEACLRSIIESCKGLPITYEVILADDNSTDTTVRAQHIFSGLKVARTEGNLGFLLNCNNAAHYAKGQYLLFLNNDTIVLPNWLNCLYDTIKASDDIAISGSKLLYPDSIIQEAGGKLFKDGSAWNLGRGKKRYDPKLNIKKNVDYISGASILVDKNFWDRVGGFDDQYQPAYCEDSDLAMAAHHEGLRVVYVPQSEVIHYEHASYGDEIEFTPQARQKENSDKLYKKWAKQFLKFDDPIP